MLHRKESSYSEQNLFQNTKNPKELWKSLLLQMLTKRVR